MKLIVQLVHEPKERLTDRTQISAGEEFYITFGYDAEGGPLQSVRLVANESITLATELVAALGEGTKLSEAFSRHVQRFSGAANYRNFLHFRHEIVPQLLIAYLVRLGKASESVPVKVPRFHVDEFCTLEFT